MLGLTALGVLGLAGTILGVVKHKKCKNLANNIAEKEKALKEANDKLAEQIKKTEIAENALKTANETIENMKNNKGAGKAKKGNLFKRLGNFVMSIVKNKML